MKKETAYFNIGKVYGSSQKWMRDPTMFLGGCGAITVCDMCIYLAMYKGRKELYPFSLPPTKNDFIRFAGLMKTYLPPRRTGIKETETYINEAGKYLDFAGSGDISLWDIKGERPVDEAWEAVKESIDNDMPLCCLTLMHKDKDFDFFRWHWYIINGYEEGERRTVKTATYARARILDFDRLWDTGYEEKGGLVFWKC